MVTSCMLLYSTLMYIFYISHVIVLFNRPSKTMLMHISHSLIYSCIYIYCVHIWGMNILFVEKSHVRAELDIPMGCFELITLRPCTCHCKRETFGLHNSGYVRGRVLLASGQDGQGGSQFAFYRPVVSTHSLELKTGRSQTPKAYS